MAPPNNEPLCKAGIAAETVERLVGRLEHQLPLAGPAPSRPGDNHDLLHEPRVPLGDTPATTPRTGYGGDGHGQSGTTTSPSSSVVRTVDPADARTSSTPGVGWP